MPTAIEFIDQQIDNPQYLTERLLVASRASDLIGYHENPMGENFEEFFTMVHRDLSLATRLTHAVAYFSLLAMARTRGNLSYELAAQLQTNTHLVNWLYCALVFKCMTFAMHFERGQLFRDGVLLPTGIRANDSEAFVIQLTTLWAMRHELMEQIKLYPEWKDESAVQLDAVQLATETIWGGDEIVDHLRTSYLEPGRNEELISRLRDGLVPPYDIVTPWWLDPAGDQP